ncbi:MAG: hypothetical protein ABSG53_28120 [Thermoguttaceae bacterium]
MGAIQGCLGKNAIAGNNVMTIDGPTTDADGLPPHVKKRFHSRNAKSAFSAWLPSGRPRSLDDSG